MSANQTIIGDSKSVNNRHVYFGSIKRAVMDLTLLWLPLRKCMVNSLIGLCQTFEKKIFSGSSCTSNKPCYK